MNTEEDKMKENKKKYLFQFNKARTTNSISKRVLKYFSDYLGIRNGGRQVLQEAP